MSLIYYNLRTLGINLGENMKKLMLIISTVLLILTLRVIHPKSEVKTRIISEQKRK